MEEITTHTQPRRKAVALQYQPDQDQAPVVIAKGKGMIADKIIAIAENYNIPLYEDPDLVEILCAVDLGDLIPPELYQAVAEVLAFVYRMNEEFSGEY